jgi:Ca2+-binding RTX toxin-like protein
LQGVAQNTIGAGTDTLINIESLRGSAFGDTLTSNGFNSVLEGGAGDDNLIGQIGGSNETVSYEHATGGVTVDMVSGTADGNASVGHDTISNFEIVRGSAYADILTGSDNSVLEGGAGGDQLIGNVVGNDASITASYQHATAGVTVSLLNPGSNTGEAAGDTFVFVSSVPGQHFNLQGSQFNDTLIGDNNNNVLNGWATRDNGSDTLTGNGGADTFVFSGGRVTITDFDHLQNDKIDLSFLNFGTGISETELQSLITNAAPGSQTLDFGNDQTLTVNVAVSSLQLGDFLGLHV